MKSDSMYRLTFAAMTAGLYLLFTLMSSVIGLSSGLIQLRLSEILCILPAFFPPAIAGLGVGCLLANLLCGAMWWDVLFGTLATVVGAVGTYLLRKHTFLRLLPPILSNAVAVGLMLRYVYGFTLSLWLLMASVAVGEALTAGVLGHFFATALQKRLPSLFPKGEKK